MEHITFDALKQQGHIPLAFHSDPENHPFQPYLEGPLPTPSGKIEFYSETLAAQGLDPLPAFVPPIESRWGKAAKQFPLEFLSRKADNYMNSTFANLDGHPQDGSAHRPPPRNPPHRRLRSRIGDGDAIKIWDDRGSRTSSPSSTPASPSE